MGGGSSNMGGRTDYPSTRPSYDAGNSRQLERDYNARREGYSNYNQRRSMPQAPRRRR